MMIWYTTVSEHLEPLHEECVMVSRIVRLSKHPSDFNVTIIHLDTGDYLFSADSMKTLSARINAVLDKSGMVDQVSLFRSVYNGHDNRK